MEEARDIARAVRDTAGMIAGEVLRPCARSIATAIALLAGVGEPEEMKDHVEYL
jgi:hypothetical protein